MGSDRPSKVKGTKYRSSGQGRTYGYEDRDIGYLQTGVGVPGKRLRRNSLVRHGRRDEKVETGAPKRTELRPDRGVLISVAGVRAFLTRKSHYETAVTEL